MVLFAIQLVRFVLFTILPAEVNDGPATAFQPAFEIVVGTHQMFNVIIRSIYFYIYVVRASHQQ